MGCSNSKTAAEAELDARVKQVVLRMARSSTRVIKGFDHVILKFPMIRDAFVNISAVFKRFDVNGDGFIDREELLECVKSFGSTASDHDLDVIFEGSNMNRTGRLTFKNFLLCMALASVLDLLPGLHVPDSEVAVEETKTSGEVHPEGGSGEAVGKALVRALQYVLQTYILFDEDGSGFIDRDEVLALLREKRGQGGPGSSSALLSEDRWKELDWDRDGSITFKEFLSAIYSWVGVEDELELRKGDGAA